MVILTSVVVAIVIIIPYRKRCRWGQSLPAPATPNLSNNHCSLGLCGSGPEPIAAQPDGILGALSSEHRSREVSMQLPRVSMAKEENSLCPPEKHWLQPPNLTSSCVFTLTAWPAPQFLVPTPVSRGDGSPARKPQPGVIPALCQLWILELRAAASFVWSTDNTAKAWGQPSVAAEGLEVDFPASPVPLHRMGLCLYLPSHGW